MQKCLSLGFELQLDLSIRMAANARSLVCMDWLTVLATFERCSQMQSDA